MVISQNVVPSLRNGDCTLTAYYVISIFPYHFLQVTRAVAVSNKKQTLNYASVRMHKRGYCMVYGNMLVCLCV